MTDVLTKKTGKLNDATEKHICCIASCTAKRLDNKKEPNLYALLESYPYANPYAKHKQSGKKWKPGTVEFFKSDEPNKPVIIVIFSRMYSGNSCFPGDNEAKRTVWFKKALDSLLTYQDLQSLAFNDGVGYLDGNGSKEEYANLIGDFYRVYKLHNGHKITITMYSNDDQVLPQKKSIVFKRKQPIIKKNAQVATIKKLGMVNKPVISDVVFYETDFFSYALETETNSMRLNTNSGILRSLPFDQSWRWILMDPQASKHLASVETKLGDVLLEDDTFPVKDEIFNAFNLCPFNKLKVVILGQDPYPTRGNAHGLAFSVKPGVRIPRSLSVIYNALVNDEDIHDFVKPKHGNLVKWAEQGVLMLNSGLTVKEGSKNCGCHVSTWSKFTDRVIQLISEKTKGVAFVLWGGKAKTKAKLISQSKHSVFEYHHPTARNNNTFAKSCKHFSMINKYLTAVGKEPIDWKL